MSSHPTRKIRALRAKAIHARELAQIMVDQKAIATLESYAAGLEAEAARLEAQAQEFPAQAMTAPTGEPATIPEAIAALKSEPEGPHET